MAEKTWTDISDAVLTAENPITQTTARQLRDNAEYARDRARSFEDTQENQTATETFIISTPGKDWAATDRFMCYFVMFLAYNASAPTPDFPIEILATNFSEVVPAQIIIDGDDGVFAYNPYIQLIGPTKVDGTILDLEIINSSAATVSITFSVSSNQLQYTVNLTGITREYGCRMIVKELFLD